MTKPLLTKFERNIPLCRPRIPKGIRTHWTQPQSVPKTSHSRQSTPLATGVAVILALICGIGCAGLGDPVDAPSEPEAAPELSAILAELAANDDQIQSFRAGGSTIIKSSQLEGVQRFRTGSVMFRRPSDLFVEGKKAIGMVAFRMVSIGDQYLIEFPVLREYYGRIDGIEVEPVPFEVPPIEIAKEMFFPIDWGKVRPRRCEIVRFEREESRLLFRYREARRVVREITVQGPPWVVVRNDRIENGDLVASTTSSDHNTKEAIRFPTRVVATFPAYETTMEFRMRNIRHNAEIEDEYFTIDDKRLSEIGLKRFGPTRNF